AEDGIRAFHVTGVQTCALPIYTPLIIAGYNQQPSAVETLLRSGADVNLPDAGGNTALMGVCFKGYPDIAEMLIAHGADLNLQHGNGGTALMFAVMFGRNNLAEILINHGEIGRASCRV